MKIFVTAAAGTEGVLKQELLELGIGGVKGARGGVEVQGNRALAARICLLSRIAVRVLVEVGRFECGDEQDLYEGVSDIGWERWLEPSKSLAVTAVSRDSQLTHTNYIAQRTKDAIVDGQRREFGERSSVDRWEADLNIFVHLSKNEAGVYLDASGKSLHLRGWRQRALTAPLKETLAAAVLRISGWDRQMPLIDPFCGSGTLVIEADQWARRIPAHARSHRFGFERWSDFDEGAQRHMDKLRAELGQQVLSTGPSCAGSDIDPAAVGLSRHHAGLTGTHAEFWQAPLSSLEVLDGPGHIIANPPYGERMEADDTLWQDIRDMIARMRSQHISLLLPEDAPRDLGPGRHAHAHRLFNGRIPCALVTWEPV